MKELIVQVYTIKDVITSKFKVRIMGEFVRSMTFTRNIIKHGKRTISQSTDQSWGLH